MQSDGIELRFFGDTRDLKGDSTLRSEGQFLRWCLSNVLVNTKHKQPCDGPLCYLVSADTAKLSCAALRCPFRTPLTQMFDAMIKRPQSGLGISPSFLEAIPHGIGDLKSSPSRKKLI